MGISLSVTCKRHATHSITDQLRTSNTPMPEYFCTYECFVQRPKKPNKCSQMRKYIVKIGSRRKYVQ